MLSVAIVPNIITLFVTVFSNATLGGLFGCYCFVSNEVGYLSISISVPLSLFISANSFSLTFGGLCPQMRRTLRCTVSVCGFVSVTLSWQSLSFCGVGLVLCPFVLAEGFISDSYQVVYGRMQAAAVEADSLLLNIPAFELVEYI